MISLLKATQVFLPPLEALWNKHAYVRNHHWNKGRIAVS
jgi:hypothetical protein